LVVRTVIEESLSGRTESANEFDPSRCFPLASHSTLLAQFNLNIITHFMEKIPFSLRSRPDPLRMPCQRGRAGRLGSNDKTGGEMSKNPRMQVVVGGSDDNNNENAR